MEVISFPSNFEFLKEHDSIFLQLASSAERAFHGDPNTTLIKLRQLAEAMAQDLATRCGIEFDQQTTQADLLYRLQRELNLDQSIRDLFHLLRVEGNKATHQFKTNHANAIDALKIARALCVWFHRSFGKNAQHFKPSTFVSPPDPSHQLQSLQQQIHQLSQQLHHASSQAESSQRLAELHDQEKQEYQQLAALMDNEARQLAETGKQQEQQLQNEREQFQQRIDQLQLSLQQKDQTEHQQVIQQQKKQLKPFVPNEDEARLLIDAQLREVGWIVDSQVITFKSGERPEKGKNKAIAEWTTSNGRADYILFIGLSPVAAIEAKRENTNVAGKLQQAERYALSFQLDAQMQPAWQPTEQSRYILPFVYSCNGRPYVKQLAEQSGIWFRDTRKGSNIARALQQFHSPEGLLDLFKRDIEKAQAQLQQEDLSYLRLRDYQNKAILAVEDALSKQQNRCLLAMATGKDYILSLTTKYYFSKVWT